MLSGPFITTAFYLKISHCHYPLSLHHRDSVSRCRYQRDQAETTTTYSEDKCLPPVFRNELKPLFTRLSDIKLLQSTNYSSKMQMKQSIVCYGADAKNVCSVVKLN